MSFCAKNCILTLILIVSFAGLSLPAQSGEGTDIHEKQITEILEDKTADEFQKVRRLAGWQDQIDEAFMSQIIHQHLVCQNDRCKPTYLWLYASLLDVPSYSSYRSEVSYLSFELDVPASCRFLEKILDLHRRENAERVIRVLGNTGDALHCLLPHIIPYFKATDDDEALKVINRWMPKPGSALDI